MLSLHETSRYSFNLFKNKLVCGVYGLRNDFGVHYEPVEHEGFWCFCCFVVSSPLGSGGYLKHVYMGRLRHDFQPLNLLYIIFHEKGTPFIYLYVPFYILQPVKSPPFHITKA